MAEKRYYWLKLKRDFFKRHDIRIIEAMPNGKDYILFYLKLLVESVDHEGALRFSETIPYNEEMLSVVTNTNIDIVRAAMKLFAELGMVEILDEGTIYMNEVQALIGSAADNDNANRQRRFRERQKTNALPTRYQRVTKNNESKSIEIESEKETEIENDETDTNVGHKSSKPVRHKYGEYRNVLLTDADLEKLKTEFPDWEARIERLSSYMASTGKSYKNHLATIRNWANNDAQRTAKEDRGGNVFMDMLNERRGQT